MMDGMQTLDATLLASAATVLPFSKRSRRRQTVTVGWNDQHLAPRSGEAVRLKILGNQGAQPRAPTTYNGIVGAHGYAPGAGVGFETTSGEGGHACPAD